MNTQYLTIDEDIEFLKVSSAKEMPEKGLEAKRIGRLRSLPQVWNLCCIALFGPLKKMLS
jgi:hypothetical protein